MNIKNQKGLTLIEATLMIGIVGAGLIGVIVIFDGVAKSSLLGDQMTTASYLAKEKIEEMVADRAANGYFPSGIAAAQAAYSDGQLAAPFDEYTRNVTILEVDPDDDNGTDDFADAQNGSGYARVTVQVTFEGGNRTVQLETLITDYTFP